jgi:hypothetical protein
MVTEADHVGVGESLGSSNEVDVSDAYLQALMSKFSKKKKKDGHSTSTSTSSSSSSSFQTCQVNTTPKKKGQLHEDDDEEDDGVDGVDDDMILTPTTAKHKAFYTEVARKIASGEVCLLPKLLLHAYMDV